MSSPQYDWFQAIPASQFNPASLTSSFQPIFTNGFPDNIKIMHAYNGSSVSVDFSFDGVNLAGTWPPGATLIVDLQTNHADFATMGSGTLNGRAGQNVWVRSALHPTYITIGGYR